MGDTVHSTDDTEAIRQIRRDIEQAENAGDAEALGEHLADAVAMRPTSGPRLKGVRAVIAFHRNHFDTYDIDVEFAIDDISVLGDLAVELGTYSGTLVPADGSEARDVGGEYLYVYERHSDGAWEIIRMSW